jgi:SAM-dependent methyltransferase
LLENPLVYSLSQSILLPGARQMLAAPYRRLFGASRGTVLDVGCGPELSTPSPPEGVIVGLDINPRYVTQYRRASPASQGSSNRLGVTGSAAQLPFADGRFDESRSVGLFHHLPDQVVRQTVFEMCRVVRGSGRVIIVDNVWPRSALCRPLAWATRRLDRGQWVRSEADLKAVVASASPAVRWSIGRMTYTLTGLELLLMEGQVEAQKDKNYADASLLLASAAPTIAGRNL